MWFWLDFFANRHFVSWYLDSSLCLCEIITCDDADLYILLSFRPACRWYLGICRPVVSYILFLYSIAIYVSTCSIRVGICFSWLLFGILMLSFAFLHSFCFFVIVVNSSAVSFTFSLHTLDSAKHNRSNHSYVTGLLHSSFAALHVIVTPKLFCSSHWCCSHHLLPIDNIS